MTSGTGASWTWKPPSAIARRSELPVQSVGDLLAQFLPLAGPPEGGGSPSVDDLQGHPFDPRLGVHKIHALSTKSGKTIHALTIEADLRAVFLVEGDTVFTVDIGTHAIYRT